MEWAVLTPVLIGVLLLVFQFTMVYHARHVALAAAQDGARVARGAPDDPNWQADAEAKARSSAQQIGPELLTGLDVQADGDANDRWVTVKGRAVQVIPFMTFTVTQRSRGPIECFRPDQGEGTDCE